MTAPPRPREQRQQDTIDRLANDVDVWVATASPDGDPYMVPLSFRWDGETVMVSTSASSPTARNLRATGKARLGIGHTRDVVMIEGTVKTVWTLDDVPSDAADAFAARAGFDPRDSSGTELYFAIRPDRVQAWREVNEIKGRLLMDKGHWLAP